MGICMNLNGVCSALEIAKTRLKLQLYKGVRELTLHGLLGIHSIALAHHIQGLD